VRERCTLDVVKGGGGGGGVVHDGWRSWHGRETSGWEWEWELGMGMLPFRLGFVLRIWSAVPDVGFLYVCVRKAILRLGLYYVNKSVQIHIYINPYMPDEFQPNVKLQFCTVWEGIASS